MAVGTFHAPLPQSSSRQMMGITFALWLERDHQLWTQLWPAFQELWCGVYVSWIHGTQGTPIRNPFDLSDNTFVPTKGSSTPIGMICSGTPTAGPPWELPPVSVSLCSALRTVLDFLYSGTWSVWGLWGVAAALLILGFCLFHPLFQRTHS